MSDIGTPASSYLQYLPALFQEADAEGRNFIGHFLLAFERMLTGLDHATAGTFPPSLAERLDGVGGDPEAGAQRYFNPGPDAASEQHRAPSEFLEWLAGWVALSLREDWTDDEKRRFISQIVPLYRLRGTAAGMIALLNVYTGGAPVTIAEFEDIPNYFQVEIDLRFGIDKGTSSKETTQIRYRRTRIARAIIDREKPAQSYYSLREMS